MFQDDVYMPISMRLALSSNELTAANLLSTESQEKTNSEFGGICGNILY